MTVFHYKPYDPDQHRSSVLALDLRASDAIEALDMSGLDSVPKALEECLRLSTESFVILKNSTVCGVFGVTTSKSHAIPWMLGTSDLGGLSFCKQAKALVEHWNLKHPPMHNLVWEGNRTSIRFLEWLGFEFPDDYPPIPVNGRNYLKFIYPRRA